MKYIIMAGGDYQHWTFQRHLSKINGEVLIERTIRLLRENNIKDISISSNNPVFEYLELPILRHKNIYISDGRKAQGYWCDAFYPTDEPTCYIFGDVYFSDEAIKTIVNTNTDDIEFFGSTPPFAKNYIKNHVEPFALKVVNTEHLKSAIQKTKELEHEGKFWRKPIMWELWTVIKDVPLQTKPDEYIYNYIAINDITCDIDNLRDVELIENMINKVIKIRKEQIMKIKALRNYTDNEIKNGSKTKVLRKGKLIEVPDGKIQRDDEYEVSIERGKQILEHPKRLAEMIELVTKEEEVLEEPKEETFFKGAHRDINTGELVRESTIIKKAKTTTKKKTTSKKKNNK